MYTMPDEIMVNYDVICGRAKKRYGVPSLPPPLSSKKSLKRLLFKSILMLLINSNLSKIFQVFKL